MKILFITKALNDVKGGAERVLCSVANEMTRQSDHEISILSFDDPDGKSFYPLEPSIKRTMIPIGKADETINLLQFFQKISAIRKQCKMHKPDIVIPFSHASFIPAAFALIGTKVPVIGSEHIVPAHYKTRKWEFLLFILSSFFMQKITVISQIIKNSYPKILNRKMLVITNPVEPFTRDSNIKQENIILTVGRLNDQKDQWILIEAFAKIAHNYPDWKVIIIGEGELEQDLHNQIEQLKIQDKITLAGTTDDIAHYYNRAKIFAFPSKYESFGLAAAEAMMHELPVLGFQDCPGLNEIIKDQDNGILVDGHNRVHAFIEGLETLINDQNLRKRLGQNGFNSVQKFQIKDITKAWIELIKNTVDDK